MAKRKKLDLGFHDFTLRIVALFLPFKWKKNVAQGVFLRALNSIEALIWQKFLVWDKKGSRQEKLNSLSRGFNTRALGLVQCAFRGGPSIRDGLL